MAGVLASVAQYETEVRRERQLAGIAQVCEQHGGKCPWGGRRPGTRVEVTEEKEAAVLAMFRDNRRVATIARTPGLTLKTVYAVFGRRDIPTDWMSGAGRSSTAAKNQSGRPSRPVK